MMMWICVTTRQVNLKTPNADEAKQNVIFSCADRVDLTGSGWNQHPVPGCCGKPLSRLELETSPLPRECSTAELQGHVWMGRVGFEPT